jgi:hypothetical protein
MPIFLILSYAFSIWMLVDAYKRGAQGWWIVIILVPLGEWVYFFVVKMQDFSGGPGFFARNTRMKCANCRYCVALYRNGATCRIHDDEVFKTPMQIEYSASYTPVPRD